MRPTFSQWSARGAAIFCAGFALFQGALALGAPFALPSAAHAQAQAENTPAASENMIKKKMVGKDGMVSREDYMRAMGEHYDKMANKDGKTKRAKLTREEAAMVIKDIGKSYGYAQ